MAKKVLSEKRKQQMRDYYLERKSIINKNKILNRINKGTQKGVQRKTIEKYANEFTAAEKDTLEGKINEKVLKTKRARVSTKTFENQKYSSTQFLSVINSDTTIKENTQKKHRSSINSFIKYFSLDPEKFSDVFLLSDEEIVETLTKAYPVIGSRVSQYYYITKMYSLMKSDPYFTRIFTEERYQKWDKIARTNDQISQGQNNLKKQTSSGNDYVPEFIKIFENELTLRKNDPGSLDHVAAILYTIGAFCDDALTTPVYVPRLDFNDVTIVQDEKDAKAKTKNYYVKSSGKLIMRIGKTHKRYNYSHIMNNVVKKYIDMSLEKHPRDKLSPVGNNSSKMQEILGIGNKAYRKAFQNIYQKIFKVPLGEMSDVMAHDVGTATASYLDKFEYTEEQRKKALEEINAQLQKNAAI
jgi:hypothetical protein